MSDNIVALPGASPLPENPMQVVPRHPAWCHHSAIIVDRHTRTIQCADPKCGAALDAFDYLLQNAQSISRAWDTHRHVMAQASEANERVTALKKEEQRLRAMIKRLQEKSGAMVVTGRGAL